MRKTKFILHVTATVALLATTGCGDDLGEGENQDSNSDSSIQFACGEAECDSATQFCYRSFWSDGEMKDEFCADLPEGCSECPCVEADAPPPGETLATACDFGVSCSQDNNAITLECTAPI